MLRLNFMLSLSFSLVKSFWCALNVHFQAERAVLGARSRVKMKKKDAANNERKWIETRNILRVNGQFFWPTVFRWFCHIFTSFFSLFLSTSFTYLFFLTTIDSVAFAFAMTLVHCELGKLCSRVGLGLIREICSNMSSRQSVKLISSLAILHTFEPHWKRVCARAFCWVSNAELIDIYEIFYSRQSMSYYRHDTL